MKIEKILNNNVVVTENDGEEKIVMGRGIAYQKRIGDIIDEKIVDKVFKLSNADTSHKFQELISNIPPEFIVLSEDIISYAKTHLGKKLNDSIYISLMDHIHMAIERFKDGILVKNALLWDIKRFYQEEFRIGLKAIEMIENRFNLTLPEDEAGFIALHLTNAAMEENVQDIYEMTKVMQEITSIVKYTFNVNFDEDSVYYYRFITHLKFFAQRLVSGNAYQDGYDADLFEMIKLRYHNSYECVKKIAEFVYNNYKYTISDEEKVYLTIHIERVVYYRK